MNSQSQIRSSNRIALVYATVPSAWEIDQFSLLSSKFKVEFISVESVCRYVAEVSRFHNLTCRAVPDYDENASYLPGLEGLLGGYDIVIVKERLGLYAYQAVKAKIRHKFRLGVMVDNLAPFPGDDIVNMRFIREEITSAADFFLVQSAAARQTLALEGVPQAKILGMPMFLPAYGSENIADRRSAIQKLGLQSDDFVLSYLGPVEWEESLFDLIHGIKIFREAHPGVAERLKLIICGVGSASDALKHRVGLLDLERFVRFMNPTRAGYEALSKCSNMQFFGSLPAQDRIDGDGYRLLFGAVHEIPFLACRGPVVEAGIGKHRIDFCQNSPASLAAALEKVFNSRTLLNNIAKKNSTLIRKSNTEEAVRDAMLKMFSGIAGQVPKIDPQSIDHQLLKVDQLIRQKSFVEAVDMIEPMLQMDGLPATTLAELLRLVGDCFTKLGDSEAGQSAYDKALSLNPRSAKAHIGLGTIALTRQENNKAIIHFQKAVGFAPGDDMAHLGLGIAFQGLDEAAEAVKWVEQALEINPISTFAIFTQMSLAGKTKDYSFAQKALERFLTLQPADHNMRYALAGIYFSQDRADLAREQAQLILDAEPKDQKALELMGHISKPHMVSSKIS